MGSNKKNKKSITGQYLSGKQKVPYPKIEEKGIMKKL